MLVEKQSSKSVLGVP